VRTDTGSSRSTARLGVTIAAIITHAVPIEHAHGTRQRERPAGPVLLRGLALLLGLALLPGLGVLAGCGNNRNGPAGAALPARPGAPAGGDPSAADASPTPSADDTPAAAARTVGAYFQEINDATRGGRVAAIDATALTGCQPCALDVGVTRSLQQRGLHADAAAYQLGDVAAQPRAGLVTSATFTLRTNTVGLLDAAGRRVTDAPGVPPRAATAQLALTPSGWRIASLRYAPAPA
jgi:hypothetical protein